MSRQIFFAYRSFWPELETVRKFHEAGVDTITFFPSNTTNSLGEPYSKYPPNWLWFDTYDFLPVERQISDLLSANPNAKLICMLDLNTPLWLSKQYAVAHIDSYDSLSCAVCNPEWRRNVGNYLEAIIAFCEKNYSDRIVSYVLACGTTDEWMDSSDGIANKAKTDAYQGTIPPRQELLLGSFDGAWRDPEKDREALRYWRFTSEVIADAIIHFAGLAKDRINREIELGVFYGYILELQGYRQVRCGHLAYEKVLDSAVVDYLISPASYADRAIGGGCGFMIPDATIRRFGKGYLQECDHRTHCYNRNLTPHVKVNWETWPDEKSDIAGMRRAMAMSLVNHASLWWFDMWGGFYQGDKCYENIALMRSLWEKYAAPVYPMNAETVMIVDPESAFYINDECEMKDIDKGIFIPVRTALSRLGAPFEIMSFRDIAAVKDFDRYKLVVMAGQFEITPEKKRILAERVLKRDRIVLWTGPAGISNGNKSSLAAMRELCGFDYHGKSGIHQMSQWTSAYIADADSLTPGFLKEFAKNAGVNLICEDELPVYANERFLAVHTATGGSLKLSLGRQVNKVVELFSGVTVAENCSDFIYEFQTPDTALFDLMPGAGKSSSN